MEFFQKFLKQNSKGVAHIIENDIFQGRYAKVGNMVIFEIIFLKTIIKSNTSIELIVLPVELSPVRNLTFNVSGNGRQYEISNIDSHLYLKALTNSLPTTEGPIVDADFCFISK